MDQSHVSVLDREMALAIDRAIAESARQHLTNLLSDLTDAQAAEKIDKAVQHVKDRLANVQKVPGVDSRDMPDYSDPNIGLFYTTWYQPRQINLARGTIEALISPRREFVGRHFIALPPETSLSQNIHLIDYAAGAHALSIGIAMAAAKCLAQSSPVGYFFVDAIDHPSMLNVGGLIWQNLRNVANANPELRWLATAMSRVRLRHNCIPSAEPRNWILPPTRGWSRWLSALHVSYEENQHEVRADLQGLSSGFNPDIAIVSAPMFKKEVADDINPYFGSPGCTRFYPRQTLKGTAEATTQVRAELADRFLLKTASLLKNPVQWLVGGNSASPYVTAYLRPR